MPSDIAERVEFYSQQAEVSLQTLEQVDNVHLVHVNLECMFTEKMVVAMTLWRHDVEDPTPTLQQVAEVFRMAPERLAPYVEPDDMWEYFSFEEQAFVDILLGVDLEPSRYEYLASCERAGKHLSDFFERLLRYCLITFMHEETMPGCWETIRTYVARNNRYKLLSQTTDNRVQLVQAAIDGDEEAIVRSVREGEQLFDKRRKNAFYAGGSQRAGGGPDNEHSVDFILAAVLQHCRRRYGSELFERVETVHDWRW